MRWIEWWNDAKPSSNKHNLHRDEQYGGTDEQKAVASNTNMFQSNHQCANNEQTQNHQNSNRYRSPSGYDPTKNYGHSQNSSNKYEEIRNNSQPQYDGGRGGAYKAHDQETLVFIGGVPREYMGDSRPILKAIEEAYDVKFNNFKPATVKVRAGMSQGWIAPIPLENSQMAAKLCGINRLDIPSMPHLRMHVRKFYSYHTPNGQTGGRYTDNGGYNDGGGRYRQSTTYNGGSGYDQRVEQYEHSNQW